MSDAQLSDTLRRILGDVYRLERELEPGGMSRVFLAREVALDRLVVLKVLPENLATTLSAERFRREIQLLARLQHPHIVPLLAAGDAEGLLWYAMPYLEGESLRKQLDRERRLSLSDAVAVLRDVARALAHAHAKGVVHRDIKPENLLRVGDAVQVADFGIARAVSVAATDAGLQHTTVGLVLGTPRYMSPEQVVADPAVDHRADLYSLGAVAFELLSGRLPYEAPTAVAMMRQHATAPVPSLRGVPGVPSALADLVTRLLAKDPAARVQTAAETLQILERLGGHVMDPTPTRHRRRWVIGLASAACAALFAVWRAGLFGPVSLIAEGKLNEESAVLMAEFTNRTKDSSLSGALQTALRVDLGQLATVRMVSAERVQRALQRMTKPPETRLTPAVAREVAEREGIAAIVEGEVSPLGSGFQIVARIVTPAGDQLAEERETAASDSELIEATGRLGRTLRRRLGASAASVRASPPLAFATTGSLPALRAYSRSVELTRTAHHVEALTAADEAIRIDSGFAMAWNARGTALFNLGDLDGEMRRSAARAFRLRGNLTEVERLQVEASYASRALDDPARSLPLLLRLGELMPDRSAPFNNAALGLMRLGRPQESIVQLRKAIAIDSTSTAPRVNLIEAFFEAGNDAGADSALVDLARRFPGRGIHERSKLDLLLDRVQLDSGIALARQIQRRARSSREQRWILSVLAAAEATRGHLRQAEEYAEAGTSTPEADGDPQVAALIWGSTILRVRKASLWLDDSAGARRVLDSLTAVRSGQAVGSVDWPLLDLAYEYAALGDARRARAVYDEQRDAVRRANGTYEDSVRFARSSWRRTVEVAVLRAEGRSEDVVRAVRQQRELRQSPLLLELGLAFEALSEPDSALASFAAYDARREAGRRYSDPFDLAWTRWHAAEVAERAGRKQDALDWYGRFVDLWRTADADLQPKVQEARRRMIALAAEPRF